MKFIVGIILSLVSLNLFSQEKNTLGMEMMEIPAGFFYMGSNGLGENYDEKPIHKVQISQPFAMSATEVTNEQYEKFNPAHKLVRGKYGFSNADNEAVIFVNWFEAVAFCEWLSKKEGKTYRLPTEAEWEYACRAGTYSAFSTGDKLPNTMLKNSEKHNSFEPVQIEVAKSKSNAFGLYDMHGNVEEWCSDWYGPYVAASQINPIGYASGEFKVTRGGSHGTLPAFLRSANRLAMLPEDKHFMTGFRVVQAELPQSVYLKQVQNKVSVKQIKYNWKNLNSEPIFMDPIEYVRPPECNSQTPFYMHNHCPAITWCPNGDLLAIWFSTDSEFGREMAIWGSRLRAGKKQWDTASLFYKVPDRNMTGSSLFYDKEENVLYHLNGVEAAGWWRNLAIVMRTSTDNGANWSKGRLIVPEHTLRNQVIAGMFKTKEGYLVQPCDAGPDNNVGTAVHISKDKGKTWEDPSNIMLNNFNAGEIGGSIAGIHAGVVQLKDGSLMALGRGNDIKNEQGETKMPMSISNDMGKTCTYSASEFPPISGGQRLVLMRLREGPIMLVSFTHHPLRSPGEKGGMLIDGVKKYGIYGAVSYDEGKSWKVKKLITDGNYRFMDGGAWTGHFEMD
jgi:formylglycine-generating enzyme required for sulfatase activity